MTSLVNLTSSSGHQIEARAMLDSGAAISVLSRKMMNRLQLKPGDEKMTVSGVESAKNSPARPTTNITVTSLSNPGWSTTVKVVILPKAARNLPEHPLPPLEKMPHLKHLTLADPQFQTPRSVDLILGVDVMAQVMLPEKISGPKGTPSAWNTELGWGIMGTCVISHSGQNCHSSDTTEKGIQGVENPVTADDTKDFSACLSSIQKLDFTVIKTRQDKDFIRQKTIEVFQAQEPIVSASTQPPKEQKKSQDEVTSEGNIHNNHDEPADAPEETSPAKGRGRNSTTTCNNVNPCSACSSLHHIFQCRQFLDGSVQQRREHVQVSSLCINCLRADHAVEECQSDHRCKLYKRTHHTFLHTDIGEISPQQQENVVPNSEGSSNPIAFLPQKEKLLTTSQDLSQTVKVDILPLETTRDLTEHPVPSQEDWLHPLDLSLTEPQFQKQRRVDLILDVGVTDEIMLPEKIKIPSRIPSDWTAKPGLGVIETCNTIPFVPICSSPVRPTSAKEVDESQSDGVLERFGVKEELHQGASTVSTQETSSQNQCEQPDSVSPPAGNYVGTLFKRKTTLQIRENRRTAIKRILENDHSLRKKGNWAQQQTGIQKSFTLVHPHPVTFQELCPSMHISNVCCFHSLQHQQQTGDCVF